MDEHTNSFGTSLVLILQITGKSLDIKAMAKITAMVGLGFPLGQIQKKAQEAGGMAARGQMDAARRELLEETGYTATHWWQLPTGYPCIGYSDERIVYFVAEGLEPGERRLDEGEFLEVLTLSLHEVRRLAACGELCDGKTLAGLYWYEQFLAGRIERIAAVQPPAQEPCS